MKPHAQTTPKTLRSTFVFKFCFSFFIFLFTPLPIQAAVAKQSDKAEITKLGSENGWDLNGSFEKTGRSCSLWNKYNVNKASGTVILTKEKEEISIVIMQKDFSKEDRVGWIELQFDVGAPIKIQTDTVGPALLLSLKKRMADAFISRFQASSKLTVNYNSWAEEYPTPLTLPSIELKKKWIDCVPVQKTSGG